MANDYKYLSNKYGTILDWFPAGGGNISVKSDNLIFIKQSGTAVCDGKYIICDLNKLLDNLDNKNDNFNNAILSDSHGIPSIETWFHTFTKKYTVHMHPSELSNILCSNNISFDNNDDEKLYINYINPGKLLSLEIYNIYNNHSIIYLMNHGIIFTSDTLEHLHYLITSVLDSYNNLFQLQNIIKKTVWKSKKYLNASKIKAYIPDIIIYLGYEIVENNNIEQYINKYNRYPILISYNNSLYIIAETKKKYYDIEEMIECYINFDKNSTTIINDNDIDKLMNWDREIYRQQI